MSPTLSVVTPVYNSTNMMKQYLEAIFASEYKDFELIIVDDASEDNPRELIEGYEVVYKRLDRRGGSAHARNKGVELAKGQLILFVDPDVMVCPDTLGKVAGVFRSHPEISGLICSYDDSPAAANTISQFKFLHHHFVHQHEGEYVASFWTGCGAIKKAVFQKLGGFDTSFFRGLNTINDIELGYRLKHGKHRVYNAKDIQVKHLKRLGSKEWLYTDVVDRGLPWLKIMIKHRDFSFKLNVNATTILSVLSAWAVVVSSALSPIADIFSTAALIWLGVFLTTNYKLLKFLAAKRGYFFSAISTPLLFIDHLSCGLCPVLGVLFYSRV